MDQEFSTLEHRLNQLIQRYQALQSEQLQSQAENLQLKAKLESLSTENRNLESRMAQTAHRIQSLLHTLPA